METGMNGEFLECVSNDLLPANAYSPLVLAYLGDAVYELYVRTHLCRKNAPVHQLHREATSYVKAESQSKMMELLEPMLTEEEQAVYKRGRNAKSATVPKNANVLDYRRATGFEALLGYLYVSHQTERLETLIRRVLL
ncbi:MAG: ribonuclease III [Clostridia bacterium]|nr:ribonuclease III [Clostridia bacterium]